ncbi:MAG: glycosyltransferase family 4 protein [Salinivirgaceae bacterium]|nr:glycosyltransferase family 4 protein [Salinivirgaceae bacterium]
MKVAHHVYNYWSYSGATQQAIKLARIMSDGEAVKSTFINSEKNTLSFYKIQEDDGITVIDLPSRLLFKIVSIFYLLVVSKYKFDIHHFHGFHLAEKLFVRIFKKTIVFKCTLEGSDDLKSLSSRKFSFLHKWIFRKVDVINSLNNRIYNINKDYIDKVKLVIIPNGVELPSAPMLEQRNIFLFAGAIVPRKQPLQVIRYYIEHYSKTGFPLILAGPCDSNLPEFNNAYYDECKALAATLPDGAIQFVGNQSKKDMARLYSISLGLIFFSSREGTPNVVLESMSYNCPIIHNERDEVTQWLLGDEIAKKLSVSDGIVKAAKVDELFKIIESKALIERGGTFSIEKTAALTLNLYNSLYEARGKQC